ncbi:endo alpha-1,4 polygalactosaminidase, partial [Streptomyces sp. NPDC087850]|uniref:endo alpha-1,4 polygalactosaminidase n=1 Tax=Streptomyces sp. NPDC087850 TaxID=3365809 RepID=UPI0037F7CDC4
MPFTPTAPPSLASFASFAARISVAPLLVALSLALTGCTDAGTTTRATTGTATADRAARPPRANEPFDYQLGGAYDPPEGVRTVIRDRTADPAPGAYNICYVNAYQAQPDAVEWWQKNHPNLLLRHADGTTVIDEDWDEPLLDISTAGRRAQLAELVGAWIDGCADDGFDAVEADNLDSYLRADGLLDRKQATAFARLLAERAHAAGLAIGQKNAAEMTGLRDRIGFDFAVSEECGRYDECDRYADAYDDRVLVIEYRRADFTAVCAQWGERLAIVLRDL